MAASLLASFAGQAATQPYDYALEYIESTGAQYMDTGLVLSNDVSVTIDIEIIATNGNQKVFGSRDHASTNNISLIYVEDNAYLDFNHGDFGRCRYISYTPRESGSRRTIELSAERRRVMKVLDGELTLDGEHTAYCADKFCTSGPAYIFDLSGTIGPNPEIWSRAAARLYSLTIKKGDELLRDYQPCVKDGVAGLYDRVTQTFLPPAEGVLKAGPIIVTPACDRVVDGSEPFVTVEPSEYPVHYIESDGVAYMDTGLTLTSTMSADIVYALVSGSDANGIFGSRASAYRQNFALSCSFAQGRRISADFLGSCSDYGPYRATIGPASLDVRYATHLGGDGCRISNLFYQVSSHESTASWGEQSAFTTPTSALIFQTGGTNWKPAVIKLYSLVIRDNGEIIRDYRPYVKDGVACVRDEVSGDFLFNTNSAGAFTAGPAIEPLTMDHAFMVTATNAQAHVALKTIGTGATRGDVFAVATRAPAYDRAVAYLESDGTQYIDTRLVLSNDVAVYLSYELVDASNGAAGIFGSRASVDSRNIAVSYAATSQVSCDFSNGAHANYRASLNPTELNKTYEVVLSAQRRSLTLNGVGKTNPSTQSGDPWCTPGPAWIFGTQKAGWNLGKIRLRTLRIEREGMAIRDYQPCVKDNVGCLYERVTRTFLYCAQPQGSAFITGETIPTPDADFVDAPFRNGPCAYAATNLVLSADGPSGGTLAFGPLQPGTRYACTLYVTNDVGAFVRYPGDVNQTLFFQTAEDSVPDGATSSLAVAYAPAQGSRLDLSVTRAGTTETQLHALLGNAYGGDETEDWKTDVVIGTFAEGAATLAVQSPYLDKNVDYLRLYTADGEWSKTIQVSTTGHVWVPSGMMVIIR